MLKKQIDDIKKLFENNKDNLIKANKEDKSSDFSYDPEKVSDIIDAFKEYNKISLKNKKQLFFTNGNPYTTIVIYLYALINEIDVTIDIDNECESINNAISKLLFSYMDDEWCDNKITINKSLSVKDLDEIIKRDKIECLFVFDNKGKFNELEKMGCKTIFQPLFSIDLYVDSSNFKFLEDLLENYCKLNCININVFEKKSIQFMVKNSEKKSSSNGLLLLTDKLSDGKSLQEKLGDKKVYVNYNPFDRFEIDMIKYFLA